MSVKKNFMWNNVKISIRQIHVKLCKHGKWELQIINYVSIVQIHIKLFQHRASELGTGIRSHVNIKQIHVKLCQHTENSL